MIDELFSNGLNARTGSYLLQPLPPLVVAKIARGEPLDPEEIRDLRLRRDNDRNRSFTHGADDLEEKIEDVGWGVLFPFARPGSPAARRQAAILDALKPLIDLRREQASATSEQRFRVFTGKEAWRPSDTKRKWLERHGVSFGPPVPEKVPYYLLIVAGPDEVDFRPQHLLDIQYAVGRLHFETVAEYAYYAQSVVAAEKGKGLALPRTMGFFGARSEDDPSTMLSAEHLVEPLAAWATEKHADWVVHTATREAATKETLTSWLGAGKTPSLLFTASHGMAFPKGDILQRPHQGALLCSDWPGPSQWDREIPQDFYLAGDDLGADARLHGLIAFNFACFGAGTPEHDSFVKQAFKDQPSALADAPFVSALPQSMLAHPGGGALAVVGHVDRAWGYSFLGGRSRDGQIPQLQVFKDSLEHLLKGRPVGFAVDTFNRRYAETAADLTAAIEDAEYEEPDPLELAELWTTQNDARGYIILGDPAVRLMVDRAGGGRPRMPLILSSDTPEPEETPVPTDNGDESDTTPPTPAGHTDFGWFSKDKDEDEEPGILKRFTQEVGEKLRATVRDLTSLEVRTFVADGRTIVDVSKLPPGELDKHATLMAYTRMAMDGDLDLLVPRAGGKVDAALWNAHKEMVIQAQTHRMELIKAALELIKPSKKK